MEQKFYFKFSKNTECRNFNHAPTLRYLSNRFDSDLSRFSIIYGIFNFLRFDILSPSI